MGAPHRAVGLVREGLGLGGRWRALVRQVTSAVMRTLATEPTRVSVDGSLGFSWACVLVSP